MKRLICLLLVTVSLAGCFEKAEVLSEKLITMQVVDVNIRSKSNSTVDLLVVGTKFIYRGQRLSCSGSWASEVKIGSKWDVWVQEYKQGDDYYTKLLGVSGICDKSQ